MVTVKCGKCPYQMCCQPSGKQQIIGVSAVACRTCLHPPIVIGLMLCEIRYLLSFLFVVVWALVNCLLLNGGHTYVADWSAMDFQTAFSERTGGSASCLEFWGVLAYCTGFQPSARDRRPHMSVMYIYLFTYSLEQSLKLTGSPLVRKFPTLYGTRRFITAFTSSRHLSLS